VYTRPQVISQYISSLDQGDRKALYRSLAWITKSSHLEEPTAQFLFSYLALESLAKYIISEKCKKSSPLAIFKTELRSPKNELNSGKNSSKSKEECINRILSEELGKNPIKAINHAYQDCVNQKIAKQIEDHLENIIPKKSIDLLFNDRDGNELLYKIRNKIAHGDVNALSEAEIDKISQRLWEVDQIARNYIFTILKDLLINAKCIYYLKGNTRKSYQINCPPSKIHMGLIYTKY
jgi:hypothetical protein